MDVNDLISAVQEGLARSEDRFDEEIKRYLIPNIGLYYSSEHNE